MKTCPYCPWETMNDSSMIDHIRYNHSNIPKLVSNFPIPQPKDISSELDYSDELSSELFDEIWGMAEALTDTRAEAEIRRKELYKMVHQERVRGKIEASKHIHTNFQSVAGGYCDEIGVEDIPNYIKQLEKELGGEKI